MKKAGALLGLIRFELPFAAGLCVVMGQMLALGKFADSVLSVSGFFAVFFISAAILVLNDYADVETDKLNAPHRPIPSGRVTKDEALVFALILTAEGLVLSLYINLLLLIIAVILAVVGSLYNIRFKKSGLPGNLMVSFSVGMTFVFGGFSVGRPYSPEALFFGLIVALVDLSEEIAADAMDAEGDKLINSGSIAIRKGREFALRISTVIFSLVVILSFVPFLPGWFTPVYLIPIGIMSFATGFNAYCLIRSNGDEGRKFIRYIYLGGTAGILLFLVMRLAGV